MTWLLVMTSPAVVMIIPVPWSSTGPPKSPLAALPGPLASIDTTSGRTLFTIVGIWAPPARAGPGATCPTLTAGAVLPVLPVPTASAIPAPTPPPMTAATTATTTHPDAPRGLAPGAEGRGAIHGTPGPGGRGEVPEGSPAGGHAGAKGASAPLQTGTVGVSVVGGAHGPTPEGGGGGADPDSTKVGSDATFAGLALESPSAGGAGGIAGASRRIGVSPSGGGGAGVNSASSAAGS